ncbi:pituitary tumor-transforming gene 1 protein-interacting protein-like isoform X2 [Dysidea avara]|uniref:pituitary tumor-transforming gene 1 protein-interacting protein-like isoform X2 n=1 Tax=Dysidea avara TaxID=196820 RepID=UPI00332CD6AA
MDSVSFVVLLLFGLVAFAVTSSRAQTSTPRPSPTPGTPCSYYNDTNCDQCTGYDDDKCYWCNADKVCREWKWSGGHILPTGTKCSGYDWNYKSCSLNGVAYAVIISVVLFVILLGITCCVICCCVWCARRNKRSWRLQQQRYEDERSDIHERAVQRRSERKSKTDEIRRKYGLENA